MSLVVSKKYGPTKVVYLAGEGERRDDTRLRTYQEVQQPAGGGKTEEVVDVEVLDDEHQHVRVHRYVLM